MSILTDIKNSMWKGLALEDRVNTRCSNCDGEAYLDLKNISSARQARYLTLYARYKMAKLQGKTHKVWNSKLDGKVRGGHRRIDGERVAIDDFFSIGGEKLFLPSDPDASLLETANCRCTVVYVNEAPPDAPETECMRLRRELALTKQALRRARQRLRRAALDIENARISFGEQMNEDIREAFSTLVLDLMGAALGRSKTELIVAVASFELWRRQFNSELPQKIRQHLTLFHREYRSASELVQSELNNERNIAKRMAELRCAGSF